MQPNIDEKKALTQKFKQKFETLLNKPAALTFKYLLRQSKQEISFKVNE